MRRRRFVLILFLLVPTLVGTWLLSRRHAPSERLYDGKPASYWVQKYTRHPSRDDAIGSSSVRAPVLERLLEIGTNAVGYLLLERDYETVIPETAMRVLTFGSRNYGQRDVLANAERGIKQIGPASLPTLFQALNSKEARMRKLAPYFLFHFHKNNPEVIPALIRALQDPETNVRGSSASALGRIGPEAKAAEIPLLAWLRENNSFFKMFIAAETLGKISPQNPELQALLSQLAAAKGIPGVRQGEVLILNQQAARILAELKASSVRPLQR